jgi:Protein of unknown function (DUF2591)
MKTRNLTGAALDWAVAKCEGELWLYEDVTKPCPGAMYSTDWAQGGPIIERVGINVSLRYASRAPNHVQDTWDALIKPEFYSTGRPESGIKKEVFVTGPSPLIAAMRCHVASQLGDEITLPQELAP